MSYLKTLLISLRKVAPHINQTRTIHRYVAPTLRELQRRKEKTGPDPPQKRSTFLEWNYDAEIFAFGKRLGENFKEDLLRQALTDRSYAIQQESNDVTGIKDNRELITDGGKYIESFIKQKYEKEYPKDVAKAVCEYLTTEKMLAHVASHMGLTDIILTQDFPVEDSTLANAFRAVISVLEQSSGGETTNKFITDFLLCQLNGIPVQDLWSPENPFEYLQKLIGRDDIEPRLCNQSASNTILANYQVGLYLNKNLLGLGWGESIETAKKTAALEAIQNVQLNKIKP